jgi:hypothetical protein
MGQKPTLYFVAFLVWATAGPATAPRSGALQVVVQDEQGGRIPGVTVRVHRFERQLTTDGSGHVSVDGLAPGEYEVTADLDSFQPERVSGIHVTENSSEPVAIRLKVQLSSQVVIPHFETNPDALRSYVDLLNAMQEPSLCNVHWKNGQGFRFIWNRTFDNPILVSLEIHPDGTGLVHYKRLSGHGGYGLGHLAVNQTREASVVDVTQINSWANIPERGFWAMPSWIETPGVIQMDGAMWVIEGVKGADCRIVERWSPKDSYFKSFSMLFLETLAKLRLYYDEVY